MSQTLRAKLVRSILGGAGAAALSLAVGLPAAAQGMTAAPAQERTADRSPAVPQPGAERMSSPADQEPYGYPSSTRNPLASPGGAAGGAGVTSNPNGTPATLPSPGTGPQTSQLSSRATTGSDRGMQPSRTSTSTPTDDRSDSSVDWLGLLGLVGLIGLAGLLPSRRTDAHRVVYRKKGRMT